VVFDSRPEPGQTITRLLTDAFSLQKRPELRNPRIWANSALLTAGTAIAVRRRRSRESS